MPDNTLSRDRLPVDADHAVIWFAVLQRARLSDNRQLAADACAELDRLGIHIRYSNHETASQGDRTTP